jgi:cell division control protein 6
MSDSQIFKNRAKLSPRYIPQYLPHRDKQIEQIQFMFKDCCIDPDDFPLTILQIIGPAGIGKTSTILKVCKLLEEKCDDNRFVMKTAYVNLKLQGGNKYGIYRYLLDRLAPELPAQGLSAEEMLRYLLRYLVENKTYALIILDEIDYLIRTTKDMGIIYDLTRLNEFDHDKSCNVKGMMFIARSTEFYSRLDQAELSTLGRVPMYFPSYSIQQVTDILNSRCSEAFNSQAIGSDIIDEVANITTSPHVNSDIRFSLDLLLYAGNLAESQGSGRITLDHIRKVYGQTKASVTIEEIEELGKNQLFTLLALVRTLRSKKKHYIGLKEIRAQSSEIAEEFKLKKLDIEDYLDDLGQRKIIDIRSFKEIGVSNMSLDELEPILKKQIRRQTK